MKNKLNQYQANHNSSPESGGLLGLLRLALILGLVLLIIWFWA